MDGLIAKYMLILKLLGSSKMLNLDTQRIVPLIVILLLILNCSTKDVSISDEEFTAPKNVILFISDGCGFNHVDAASYYQYGKTGERQPFRQVLQSRR